MNKKPDDTQLNPNDVQWTDNELLRLRLRIGSRFQDAVASHWLLLAFVLIVLGALALYIFI